MKTLCFHVIITKRLFQCRKSVFNRGVDRKTAYNTSEGRRTFSTNIGSKAVSGYRHRQKNCFHYRQRQKILSMY